MYADCVAERTRQGDAAFRQCSAGTSPNPAPRAAALQGLYNFRDGESLSLLLTCYVADSTFKTPTLPP